jgi:dihydroxy-acid dehydratase
MQVMTGRKEHPPAGHRDRKSVANGVTVDMALGCSTNTVLHLPAIFREAELDL